MSIDRSEFVLFLLAFHVAASLSCFPYKFALPCLLESFRLTIRLAPFLSHLIDLQLSVAFRLKIRHFY